MSDCTTGILTRNVNPFNKTKIYSSDFFKKIFTTDKCLKKEVLQCPIKWMQLLEF